MAAPWLKYQATPAPGEAPPAVQAGPWQKYGQAAPAAAAADPPIAESAAPSKPADRGVIDAALRNIAQGATANFLDEIVGGIGGGLDWMGLGPEGSKGTFTGGYNRTVANARAMDQAAEENHPIVSAASNIGGAIATLPLLPEAAAAKVLGLGVKGSGIAARTGRSAAGGLAYGAAAGTGAAEGDLAERAKGGLEGGLVGIAGGAVAPGIARVASKAVGAAGRQLRVGSVEKEAGRRAKVALEQDLGGDAGRAVTALEQAQRQGKPLMAADMGETTRALGRSAANQSPEGRAAFNQALEARHATQLDRTTDIIKRAAPFTDSLAAREKLELAARKLNKPAYAKAYQDGERGVWSPELERLTGSPEVVAAMSQAVVKGKDRAIEEGFGAFNPGVKVTGDGQLIFTKGKSGVATYPNLQFWDYTKRALDDTAKKLKRAGADDEARVIGGLARKLRDELDTLVPSYAEARGTAFAFFGAENAVDAGANFVTQRADDFIAAKAAHAKMNAVEKELFAGSFASSLIARLRETGDRHNIINSIFLKSPAAKERIAVALGPRGIGPLEAHLRLETIFEATKHGLQGNSRTAQQLVELGLASSAGTISTGGNFGDPFTYINAALTYGLLRTGRKVAGKVDTRVATEVARLLASGDPEVVKKAIERVGRSPRLLNALRIGEGKLSRILVPLAGRGSGVPEVAAGAAPANADEEIEE